MRVAAVGHRQALLGHSGFSNINKAQSRDRLKQSQHDPLIVPSQRQTRVRQQLVGGQIGRLAPVEDGLRDVRGEIAEADVSDDETQILSIPLRLRCTAPGARSRCGSTGPTRLPQPNPMRG
jgi:hypothetical protein